MRTEGAARAGVAAGDIVRALDGRPVHGTAGVVDALLGRLPGEQVTLTVARSSGGQDQVRVLLGER